MSCHGREFDIGISTEMNNQPDNKYRICLLRPWSRAQCHTAMIPVLSTRIRSYNPNAILDLDLDEYRIVE